MESNEKYAMCQTKISIPMWRRLRHIMKRMGLKSIYGIIQNFIDVFIRFTDDRHNLTPESELLMGAFEHCENWGTNFNLCDHTADPEISEATYYLRDKKKKGVRVFHVERPFFGQWTQTWNVQQILEKFLCLTFPQLYMRLRAIAVFRECNSILELLYTIVTEQEAEENKAEFRKPFEDAERSEWGRKPHEQPYRRHHHKGVDSMESPSLFDHDGEEDEDEEKDFENK